jgi:type I restriction enzyme, S subunit
VAEIEKQFTRLDAGVASLKRVQPALKSYRAGVLKAACEGRLVPTEAELARKENRSYETGEQLLHRILKERREKWNGNGKYKEPRPPQSAPADELPEGWIWASWDQVGFSQNGRPFKSVEYQPTGFKLLRPGNLHISGRVVWTSDNTRYVPQHRADENRDLIVCGRELVMNLTAQSLRDEFLGRVCLTSKGEECLLNQRLARLTPILIPPEFALYLLKAWRFRRFVDELNTGSLIQHMFTSQLAQFTFPMPPLPEQTRIAAKLSELLSISDNIEAIAKGAVSHGKTLRDAILHQTFEVN